jgi:chemotaxis protein histidine kinase CheA
MSTSAGLLDFFILEASDYIEQLDGVVARAGAGGPDADALMRSARSLRGSATMAKLTGIAEIAAAVERLGRSLRERSLVWDAALKGAVISAIDDLKILLRAVRTWGDAEDRRVAARLGDLSRHAPTLRAHATPGTAGLGAGFLAAETAQIAAALDAFLGRPTARDALMLAITRVRALRGVAALKDLPPLAEVIDAIDRAAKPIELGGVAPDGTQLALLAAAVRVLRRASQEIATRGRPTAVTPESEAFAAAANALEDANANAEHVVPVSSLFFTDDGPHVLTSASNPPTSPPERFRLEVVSQAEHLRGLITDAAVAADPAAVSRLGRALRSALRALHAAAESFDQHELAELLARSADRVVSAVPSGALTLDPVTLRALDQIASLLAAPSTPPETLARRIAELAGAREAAPTEPLGTPAVGAPSPAAARPPTASPERARLRTPTGQDLQAFLETGIAGFAPLATRPLSEPVPIVEGDIVPIQNLLYAGRAALDRALELRTELTRQGGTPSHDALAELFDLLELATAS